MRKDLYISQPQADIFGFDYVSALAKGLFGIKEMLFFSAEGLDIHGNNPEEILKITENEITEKLG